MNNLENKSILFSRAFSACVSHQRFVPQFIRHRHLIFTIPIYDDIEPKAQEQVSLFSMI